MYNLVHFIINIFDGKAVFGAGAAKMRSPVIRTRFHFRARSFLK